MRDVPSTRRDLAKVRSVLVGLELALDDVFALVGMHFDDAYRASNSTSRPRTMRPYSARGRV